MVGPLRIHHRGDGTHSVSGIPRLLPAIHQSPLSWIRTHRQEHLPQVARQIRSGRHEITFDDPVVSDTDPGLQVLILGTVYVDEAAPADPSVGYEGSDRIDFSRARIIAQRWDDTAGAFRDVKSDFNPSMIY